MALFNPFTQIQPGWSVGGKLVVALGTNYHFKKQSLAAIVILYLDLKLQVFSQNLKLTSRHFRLLPVYHALPDS